MPSSMYLILYVLLYTMTGNEPLLLTFDRPLILYHCIRRQYLLCVVFLHNTLHLTHDIPPINVFPSIFQGDYRNWTTSALAQCAPHSHSVSSLLPVPLPTTQLPSSSNNNQPNPNQFVVAKDFASGVGDCNNPQLLSDFFATRNRYCHRAFGQSAFQSYLLLYPYVYFYYDYDCNPDNLLGSSAFPSSCEASESDPFYYFAQVDIAAVS